VSTSSRWDVGIPSWWLSFVDPDEDQFLGAAIVTAPGPKEAVLMAHALECNPGGEVLIAKIPVDTAPFIRDHWRCRVLTREETKVFDEEIQSVCEAAARRAASGAPFTIDDV
jgi:hypothetical protein